MTAFDPLRTLKRPLDERGASYHRAAEPRPPYFVVCYGIAHILKGTTMRSIIGLVITVVVIVVVLRFLGVL